MVPQQNQAAAQNSADTEKVALARRNELLRIENVELEQKIKQQSEAVQKAKEAERRTEEVQAHNARIAEFKAQKDLLGDAKPTPLSGSVTISNGETALAETRALTYGGLEVLLKRFMGTQDGEGIAKKVGCCATVVLYDPAYHQAVPDYHALLAELNRLTEQYEDTEKALSRKPEHEEGSEMKINEFAGPSAVVGAIAVGSKVLNVLASTAMLLRTETEYQISREEVGEDVLMSLIRKNDRGSGRKYFFPALYVPTGDGGSVLMERLAALDLARNTLNEAILDGNPGEKSPVVKTQQALDEVYAALNESLAQPVGKESSTSVLRQFLRVEKLLEKLKDDNTYTLRLVAKASGTNRITKFLWWTFLKHSAGVEAQYQLFDRDANLVSADAAFEYTEYRKSRQISQGFR